MNSKITKDSCTNPFLTSTNSANQYTSPILFRQLIPFKLIFTFSRITFFFNHSISYVTHIQKNDMRIGITNIVNNN